MRSSLLIALTVGVVSACETFSTTPAPSGLDGGGFDGGGDALGPDAVAPADGGAETSTPHSGAFSCGAHPGASLCDEFERTVVLGLPTKGGPWGYVGPDVAEKHFSLVPDGSLGNVLEFSAGQGVTSYLKVSVPNRSVVVSLAVRFPTAGGASVVVASLPYAAATGIGAVALVADAGGAPGRVSVRLEDHQPQAGTPLRIGDVFMVNANVEWHRFEMVLSVAVDGTRIESVSMDGRGGSFEPALLPATPTELQVGALPNPSMPPMPWTVRMDDVLVEPR